MTYKISTPPQHDFDKKKYEPDISKFLIALRTQVLNITIDELINCFNWTNEKYYQQIVNGYKDKDGNIKLKQPTVKHLFSALNYAMDNYDIFQQKKNEINDLIKKYIIRF